MDGELAKVALSFHMALDIFCQDMYEVERRRGLLTSLFNFDFANSRRAEGGLPPCARIGTDNTQRVVLFLSCVLKVR